MRSVSLITLPFIALPLALLLLAGCSVTSAKPTDARGADGHVRHEVIHASTAPDGETADRRVFVHRVSNARTGAAEAGTVVSQEGGYVFVMPQIGDIEIPEIDISDIEKAIEAARARVAAGEHDIRVHREVVRDEEGNARVIVLSLRDGESFETIDVEAIRQRVAEGVARSREAMEKTREAMERTRADMERLRVSLPRAPRAPDAPRRPDPVK
jgi:hypothetical protein